ncbi:pilus assembly protein PilM [Effusibacillus pohliae]|uniref:pilus assembly protein PilM n=1 Tax=Effusibacillus pohliae TaxID=232270 RepID=UPI00036615D7|nr:pilus assembly protein PilM [Effusibacillus pohliae]
MWFLLQRHTGVGISLQEDRIEVAQVRGGRGIDVVAHTVIPFAQGVYENGRVLDVGRFAAELRNAFDAYDLPKKGVTVSLPSPVSFLRMLAMPNVNRKQMESLLQFQIQDEIRLPIADPIYDFAYYPPAFQAAANSHAAEGEPEQAWILLVAAPRDLVDALVRGFREAGIRLAAIEVKGMSILRAIKAINRLPEKAAIAIEFGAERVDVHVYQKGGLLTTRSLDLRADDYVEQYADGALQEVAASQEADGRRLSVAGSGTWPTGQSSWRALDDDGQAASLDSFSRDLSFQLQRSISFVQYSLKQRDVAVETLFLAGDVPNPRRLAENLHNQLDLPVEHLQIPAVLRQPDGRPQMVSLSAAGAALRGFVSNAD